VRSRKKLELEGISAYRAELALAVPDAGSVATARDLGDYPADRGEGAVSCEPASEEEVDAMEARGGWDLGNLDGSADRFMWEGERDRPSWTAISGRDPSY
jgi:hypothetical protein